MINISKNYKTKTAKRLGRGISAGGGKTAGRGTKGQKSRAGHNIPRQFEGGQTNLSLRLPKIRGFRKFNDKTAEISLDVLSKNYKEGDTVTIENLLKKNLVKIHEKVKILANGNIDFYLDFDKSVKVSKKALEIVSSNKSSSKSVTSELKSNKTAIKAPKSSQSKKK